jgi:MerR family transcriptional regulator, light-induced transcriptional regulator
MTEEPLYNIGVVTRVTGIPIPTLHAWERRYKFPVAARTSGGHRLYSEKDIARLRWVKAQLDSGLAVSRAISAARSLEADGRLFLPPAPDSGAHLGPTPAASSLSTNLVEALIHHDLPGADRLMNEMLAFYSPEDLTLNVVGPALNAIGESWEHGQITVASEHLASNYLRHRLLMWMVTGPSPRTASPIILACGPGEWHEGSLLMLGVLLRRLGWPVAYLGQNVPFHDLAKFIEQIHPPAVVLVAMLEENARLLADWPQWIEQTDGQPVIAFGGRAFVTEPELIALVSGIYLGANLEDGLTNLLSLIGKEKK